MESFKVICIGSFGHLVDVFDELVEMPQVQFVGYAPAYEGENLDRVKNHRFCGSTAKFYEDFRQLLKSAQPNLAIVSTRLDLIADVAAEAASFGCHLICEKPLAINHERLENLYDAVKRSGVGIMAMFTMRSLPAFIAARSVCQSGRIGQIVLVNSRKSYKWGQRPAWFARRDTYGGTIGWIGIHALDMTRFVTGTWFVSVAAMQSNFAHRDFQDCEDNCALILSLANGGHATASIDILRPETAPTHGDDWIRIVGTKGVIEANGTANTCHLLLNEGTPQNLALGEPEKIYRQFIQHLLDGKSVGGIAEDSFMLTYVSLCARDAADKSVIQSIDQKFSF